MECPAGRDCPSTGLTEPAECPAYSYCPGASAAITCPDGTYTDSDTRNLETSEQCFLCPTGKYCTNGEITGDCDAGYWCDYGADSATPATKLCPLNRYCELGTLVPSVCDQNRIIDFRGATSSDDCQECSGGRFYNCLPEYVCPKGHYCEANPYNDELDTSEDWNEPLPCPERTYRDAEGAVNYDEPQTQSDGECTQCTTAYDSLFTGSYTCSDDGDDIVDCDACANGVFCESTDDMPTSTWNCTDCPPGYLCGQTGISDLDDWQCPPGHYCPKWKGYLGTECPKGTYQPEFAQTAESACLDCPAGSYCPGASTHPIACAEGSFCPAGSSSPKPCPKGSYCPYQSQNSIICPAGFYCPNAESNIYLKC